MLAKAINGDRGENRVAHCLGRVARLIESRARAFAFGQDAEAALIALPQNSVRNSSVGQFFLLSSLAIAITTLTTISSHLLGRPYTSSARARV